MTLGAGKEPLRVKNSRAPKTTMNNLDKASTSNGPPTVVIPKRKPNDRRKQESNDQTTELSSDNAPAAWRSPKIINRNAGRDNRTINGRPAGVMARETQNARNGNLDLNNFSSASTKDTSGKSVRLGVSGTSTTRDRQHVLNKYNGTERNKTFVVAKNNED